MKVSYILRADKKSAAGLAPVHVVIHYDGKRLKAGIGEKCKPVTWNQASQRFCASPLGSKAGLSRGRRMSATPTDNRWQFGRDQRSQLSDELFRD